MAPVRWYGKAAQHLDSGKIDWVNDTIKGTLHTSSHSPNQDTHDYFDDVTNELGTGGGYTAGGIALTNKTRSYDAATNTEILDADDFVIANATLTARYLVLRKARGGAASADELVGYVDFVTDAAPNGVTFTVAWDATYGVLKAVVAT